MTGAGCRCVVVIPFGATVDLDGDPTPALYAFSRKVDGDILLAPIPAYGESDYMSATEIRAACKALKLDLAIFDTPH